MFGDLILTFFGVLRFELALVEEVFLDLLLADFMDDFVPHIELESVLLVFSLLLKQLLITDVDLSFGVLRPLFYDG